MPDADAASDSGGLDPVTCGGPTELDTANSNVIDVRAATLSSGKYFVAWTELPSGPEITKARVFDGTQFLPEQTLSVTGVSGVPIVASDGQGRGYATLPGTSIGRAVLDNGTLTFGTTTTVSGLGPFGLAGLPSGGAFVLYGAGTSPTVTQYDPGTTSWGAPTTPLAGNFRLEGIASNGAGQAAMTWVDTFTTGFPLYVSAFDGAAWSTPTTSLPIGPGGQGAEVGEQTPLVYANGDVLVVYTTTNAAQNAIASVRYHPTTNVFDAPVPIASDSGSVSLGSAFIDASDRVTVLYVSAGQLDAVRDVGAGWTAPVSLGSARAVAAMDPNGNLAALTVVAQPMLTRLAAAGSVWTTPVPTGLANINNATQLALAFDAVGHPVLFAHQLVNSRGALEVVDCQ